MKADSPWFASPNPALVEAEEEVEEQQQMAPLLAQKTTMPQQMTPLLAQKTTMPQQMTPLLGLMVLRPK